jgi:hypothetical protein
MKQTILQENFLSYKNICLFICGSTVIFLDLGRFFQFFNPIRSR